VPQPPAQAQQGSAAVTALILVQEQSGNSREVIRVSGVTYTEEDRHEKGRQHASIIPGARSKITDTIPNR
jgi:hypothetical protein